MARRGTSPDGSKVERRKTSRYFVSVPIEVIWPGPDGLTSREAAVARQVNANGGFLEMSVYPEVGSRLTLTNTLSEQTVEARVLGTPYSREGVSHGIIVELITPSESFWGVNLQVKKSGVELQKLEKSLRSEGIDLRLLNEYRDAVDFIRTVALSVQQLRDRQLHGIDSSEIIAKIATERVRRAQNLCLELTADLDARDITMETKGIEELYQSLEQACDRLRHLLKSRQPDRYVTSRS